MEDKELKAIQEAILKQRTNNVPQIYIQDLHSGRVFEYGKNCHDRLVISEDGRSLHYENLQDGDGSKFGDYRFYYEKPKIETEMDKMHEWDLDHWARNVENKSLDKFKQENQALKDKWNKLKEIISTKQHIKDKATDLVTLLGASGVEVFCEMLLKEMQKLEEQKIY